MTDSKLRITYVGTATALLEVNGLRLVTDPALDEPGGEYAFAFGTGSKKVLGPALSAEQLGQVDAVLLSHDQHADNLDTKGRAFLAQAKQVITTRSGARRLGGSAVGLAPWESLKLGSLTITATPCRHGPPLSRPIVGDVIGFVLEWPQQQHGALYISGDTVLYSGLDDLGERFRIGTAVLHLGGVRFGISGPLRYTMNGAEAVRLVQSLKPGPRTIIPLHYDGWTHFREPLAQAKQSFASAGLQDRLLWLAPGVPTEVEV